MNKEKEMKLMKEIKELEKEMVIMKHDYKMEELQLERKNQKTRFEDQMSMHRIKRKDGETAMLLKNRLIREGKRP